MGLAVVEPITESVVVAIESVGSSDERTGRRFLVTATSADKCWQFTTWNQFVASLCDGAHRSQRAVKIIYRKQRKPWIGTWTPQIVRAELEPVR